MNDREKDNPTPAAGRKPLPEQIPDVELEKVSGGVIRSVGNRDGGDGTGH